MKARLLPMLGALLLAGCSGEMEEVEVGYRGSARRNPFLAAERLLAAEGYDVSSWMWLQEAPPEHGILVAPAQALTDHIVRDEVLTWVADGGHLFVMLTGGETFRDDFDLLKSPRRESANPPGMDELHEALGVGEVRFSSGSVKAKLGTSTAAVAMPARFKWKGGSRARGGALAAEGDDIAIASHRQGRGRITIAASATPFRNRKIGEDDNAWLFRRLIALHPGDTVWFLNGSRASFMALLWEHGWMALVAAGLLLVVWLWKSMPRFGPMRSADGGGQRDFAEHLTLTGAFLWRHRQRGPLLAPLRESVTRAAARRGFSRTADDLPEALAEFAQMPALRVRAALTGEAPAESRHFLRIIQDLQRLHDALSP